MKKLCAIFGLCLICGCKTATPTAVTVKTIASVARVLAVPIVPQTLTISCPSLALVDESTDLVNWSAVTNVDEDDPVTVTNSQPCCFYRGLPYVNLTWNPDADTNIAGYTVYAGTASRNYTQTSWVGNITNCIIPVANVGATNYFAVTCSAPTGAQSAFSNEATWTFGQTILTITIP